MWYLIYGKSNGMWYLIYGKSNGMWYLIYGKSNGMWYLIYGESNRMWYLIYIEYYMVNVVSARVSAQGTGISPSPEGEGRYQTEG